MSVNERPALTQVAPIDPIWCDGVGEIEVMAGTVRLTMFVVEHAPNGDGPTRRRASLKLILSTEALMDGIVMTLGALATAGTQSTQRVVSGVVH